MSWDFRYYGWKFVNPTIPIASNFKAFPEVNPVPVSCTSCCAVDVPIIYISTPYVSHENVSTNNINITSLEYLGTATNIFLLESFEISIIFISVPGVTKLSKIAENH